MQRGSGAGGSGADSGGVTLRDVVEGYRQGYLTH